MDNDENENGEIIHLTRRHLSIAGDGTTFRAWTLASKRRAREFCFFSAFMLDARDGLSYSPRQIA